jgi:hypothetical protein
MNPREEAADLTQNPLPSVIIVDPLTRVISLEGEIEKVQELLSDLEAQRQEALEYAVKNGIEEDAKYRLEKKVKTFRTLNVKRFSEVFPDEYRIAKELELKELRDKIEKAGEKITLGLVDKLVKPVALAAAPGVISTKETVTYQVVSK